MPVRCRLIVVSRERFDRDHRIRVDRRSVASKQRQGRDGRSQPRAESLKAGMSSVAEKVGRGSGHERAKPNLERQRPRSRSLRFGKSAADGEDVAAFLHVVRREDDRIPGGDTEEYLGDARDPLLPRAHQPRLPRGRGWRSARALRTPACVAGVAGRQADRDVQCSLGHLDTRSQRVRPSRQEARRKVGGDFPTSAPVGSA